MRHALAEHWAIAWPARGFFLIAMKSLFFWGGPVFRDGKAHLFLKKWASNSKHSSRSVDFTHARQAIAWRARAFFFDCNEKPFFWGGPFFRDDKAHLFLKRWASNSKHSSRSVHFTHARKAIAPERSLKLFFKNYKRNFLTVAALLAFYEPPSWQASSIESKNSLRWNNRT